MLLSYWHWDVISVVSPSLSYISVMGGVWDCCFYTWIYLMTLLTTLSYTSSLILHPDLLRYNSSYSESEYSFHLLLQPHQALPTSSHSTHTHTPPLPLSLGLYPSCVHQVELTKGRTNGVKVFWNPWNTDELGGIWKQNQTLEIKETSKLLS